MRAPEGAGADAVAGAEASGVDTDELAARLYRMLERRLRIDKERLGIGRG